MACPSSLGKRTLIITDHLRLAIPVVGAFFMQIASLTSYTLEVFGLIMVGITKPERETKPFEKMKKEVSDLIGMNLGPSHDIGLVTFDYSKEWLQLCDEFEDELMHDQNNQYHGEGAVGEHVIMMLSDLYEGTATPEFNPDVGLWMCGCDEDVWLLDDIEEDMFVLVMSIFFSDLGKLKTYSEPINKKTGEFNRTWACGSPQGAAYGHATHSAWIFFQWLTSTVNPLKETLSNKQISEIHWIVQNHMEAHDMMAYLDGTKQRPKKLGMFDHPEDIVPHLLDKPNYEWPEYDEFTNKESPHYDIAFTNKVNKQTYKFARLYAGRLGSLLMIKQHVDSSGRIDLTV